MKLWTQQPLSVWKQVLRNNVYYPDVHHQNVLKNIGAWSLIVTEPYDWMTQQLAQRVTKPAKATVPVWWWLNDQKQPPHFSSDDRNNPDDPYVIVEADVNYCDALFSDFELWTYVINNMYLHPITNETNDQWNKTQNWFESLPTVQQCAELTRSWELIFGIHPLANMGTQACTWSINLDTVTKVFDQSGNYPLS